MHLLSPAQLDLDNWLEIIIAIVVVGGSLFGAISKKLIKVFSPKRPDSVPPSADRAGRPLKPRSAFGGSRPTAQPMPPKPQQQRTAVRPISQPLPPRPVHPPTARPVRPPRPTLRPAAIKPVARAEKPPAVRHVPAARRIQTKPARTKDRLGHLTPSVEEHLGHLVSGLDDEGHRVSAVVEQHLGHLEPTVEPATVTTRTKRSRDREEAALAPTSKLIRRLTPGTLRQAVLLREILGPPVSVRPPDDLL